LSYRTSRTIKGDTNSGLGGTKCSKHLSNSINPSHKKAAELKYFLFWPVRNLHAQMRRLLGLLDPTVLGVMCVGLLPYHCPPTVIFSIPSFLTNRSSLSLSQAWCSKLLCSDLCDSLRDLALESVRKLEKILLLYSYALGEALATWCVRYSWSMAPRRLAVAW